MQNAADGAFPFGNGKGSRQACTCAIAGSGNTSVLICGSWYLAPGVRRAAGGRYTLPLRGRARGPPKKRSGGMLGGFFSVWGNGGPDIAIMYFYLLKIRDKDAGSSTVIHRFGVLILGWLI